MILDLTASPDYSEVESDPFIYQLSPYEISLYENRPFFSEASSYFESNKDLGVASLILVFDLCQLLCDCKSSTGVDFRNSFFWRTKPWHLLIQGMP